MAGPKGPGRDKADQDTDAIRRRLDDLEGKLGEIRARHDPKAEEDRSERGRAMGNAMRLATELVAGVIVGGFIGWGLDQWFGTGPIMMVVFLVLGSAAGILNVIRSAKAMQVKGPLPGKDLPPDSFEEDE
ncbi:ATP synthase protein I [Methyloligella halotolerans]|uniref:ATP synthase protein I n=1 Tax=Methyloligella halotolerans TaxID=1177755 RepID=A0A1E2RYF6_9HYPH|nr:AtpZ/AtpI family protein [Methyloligella halotolerans]ODA67251.1 ATP synthase protein I [Methyloligella halotolerans]